MAAFDAASLSESEQRFLQALGDLGVRYLVVGMSAALLQGARGATEGIDLWFHDLSDPRIGEAAHRSGGFWVTRSEPPMLGGMGERFDVVTTMSGLPDFDEEYARAKEFSVDGVALKVLPLERIIASKRAANRSKDQVVLQNLELTLKLLDK